MSTPTNPIPDRLRRSGARCLQSITGRPYQRCLHDLAADPDKVDAVTRQVGRVLELVADGRYADDDGTGIEFDDLVVAVVAATSAHVPEFDPPHDAYVTELPGSRIAVHWPFGWNELEVFVTGEGGRKLDAIETGLRSIPNDPYLAARKIVEALDQAQEPEDPLQVSRRVELAVRRLVEQHGPFSGNALAWRLDAGDDATARLDVPDLARLDGETAHDVPGAASEEVAGDLRDLATALGRTDVDTVAGWSYDRITALCDADTRLHLRDASGEMATVDGDPRPAAARRARQTGEVVDVVRHVAGMEGPSVVWLTMQPCTCSCHSRRLSPSDCHDLHSPQFSRRCPCEDGFSHAVVTGLRAGDTVVDVDGTRHIAATRWVMDDYDGTGLVQIDFAEPDRYGATSDTLLDQAMLFTRR